MEISGSSSFYSGLNTIQSVQSLVDQAAGKIASAATSQPSDAQNDRFQAVNCGQPTNSPSNMVELVEGKFQVELGVKVAKASNEMLGTLIDTYA